MRDWILVFLIGVFVVVVVVVVVFVFFIVNIVVIATSFGQPIASLFISLIIS